jgi:hypothetical protein
MNHNYQLIISLVTHVRYQVNGQCLLLAFFSGAGMKFIGLQLYIYCTLYRELDRQ